MNENANELAGCALTPEEAARRHLNTGGVGLANNPELAQAWEASRAECLAHLECFKRVDGKLVYHGDTE